MKIAEVRKRAFAMPLTNPSFPPAVVRKNWIRRIACLCAQLQSDDSQFDGCPYGRLGLWQCRPMLKETSKK